MSKFRLAFMGTPDFSVGALTALKDAGHEIVCVYAQAPKPAGRGQQLRKTPVHLAAEALGIEVRTPKTLRDKDEQAYFQALKLDIAVVVAYGLILPEAILSAPSSGCLNIHASLLPRWRGAAPIQRAILAGDTESGVTIMQMDVGLDTGPMLIKGSVPIDQETTAGALHDALSLMGAKLIVEALDAIADSSITITSQPTDGITYAAKLSRDEGQIDWSKPAIELERQIRGLAPWPGSFFKIQGEAIKIIAAEIKLNAHGTPGTLLDDQFTVACGSGALTLTKVQRSGKNATDGASFLRGARLTVGQPL